MGKPAPIETIIEDDQLEEGQGLLSLAYVPVNVAIHLVWASNPKKHDIGGLVRSFIQHGFKDAPHFDVNLVNVEGGQGAIDDGNGRVEALYHMECTGNYSPPAGIGTVKADGAWAVPVLFGVDADSEAAAKAYAIDANNLTLDGAGFSAIEKARLWDEGAYVAILQELAEDEVMPVSADEEDLQDLMRYLAAQSGDGGDVPDAPEDKAEQLQEVWQVQPGQVWEIPSVSVPGQVHRVMCGDSCIKDHVEALLAGAEPYLMVTDPPYGVNYDPGWRAELAAEGVLWYGPTRLEAVEGDDQADWTEAFTLSPPSVSVVYCWQDALQASLTQQMLAAGKFEIRNQIIWVKHNFPLSRGAYTWRHETCWYAVREGQPACWIGGDDQSTIWDDITGLDKVEGANSTQKPLECMARPIRNHEGDVYDAFLGCGTTIIGCEQLGRVGYGMEVRPKMVAVALQWLTDIGLAPRVAED